MDFGLAKRLEKESELTLSGQPLLCAWRTKGQSMKNHCPKARSEAMWELPSHMVLILFCLLRVTACELSLCRTTFAVSQCCRTRPLPSR